MSNDEPHPHPHPHDDDPRNATILISVNGELVVRSDARVSVFDSGFLSGDGVWEGIRLHNDRFAFLDRHLDRLYRGADAIGMDVGRGREELADELQRTTDANAMHSDVHVRVVVSRGIKATASHDPRVTLSDPTVVIIPEHKRVPAELQEHGIRLASVATRRGPAEVQDPRVNSLSRHGCIQACIEAARKGADDGLMLDPHGGVAGCSAANLFVVRSGEVWTSTGRYCTDGITRQNVIELCEQSRLPILLRDFKPEDVRSADEVFVTATSSGVVPVRELDGRAVGGGRRGEVTLHVQCLYRALLERECPAR